MKREITITLRYDLAIGKVNPNPPPKRRYGYFGLSEGAFFQKFQKKLRILP